MDRSTNQYDGKLIGMANANALRSDKILVDVVLIVDGQRLEPCHKFMLASSSPYFRAMFSHGMIEQSKGEIEISGVDRPSLEAIIDYIYTGRIALTDDNAQSLLTSCSLLQMTSLYNTCREYMITRVDVNNCVSMYQLARSICCVRLQSEALRFISKRFRDVSATDDWLKMSKHELIDIIGLDDLWITSEEIVYEAALSWLVSDLNGRSKFTAEVLSHIRFALIEEEFIDKCILEEGMVLEHPLVRIQIDAAKSYIMSKKINEGGTKRLDGDSETSSGIPYYVLPIQGVEKAVKIPLNITPRAGMNTRELLLFSNGRRTFALNPDGRSEYYGCLVERPEAQMKGGQTCRFGWSPDIPMMKNPEAHTTEDGSVFLLGGLEIERSTPLKVRTKLFRLEIGTLTWLSCASMPTPRCMAACGDGCGYLYVMGGKTLADGEVVSSVYKYEIDDNSWCEVTPMPMAVYGHATASYKDMIYSTGGKTAQKNLVGNVFCLDCSSDTWTEVAPLSTPRFLHAVTSDPTRNRIFVLGGSGDNGILDSVEEFRLDMDSERWIYGESFPGNRCAQHATEFNGEIHAIGGYITERSSSGRFESREIHDVFVLNSNNQWSRKIRRIRGASPISTPMACVKVKLHISGIPRASILTE